MSRLILVLIMLLTGCASVGSVSRPQTDFIPEPNIEDDGALLSIAGADDGVINALLNHNLSLPRSNRIAIVKLQSGNRRRYYSSEFNEISDEIITGLIVRLRNNNRVYDASFLPSMLLPQSRSVPVLREAAARFQADLLLVYNENCQSYQKHRFTKSDLNKSYCQVEAVLMDTRSGIVAKTVVSLEEFESRKTGDDLNLRDAVRKAELNAIAKALGNVAKEIDEFLVNVPVL